MALVPPSRTLGLVCGGAGGEASSDAWQEFGRRIAGAIRAAAAEKVQIANVDDVPGLVAPSADGHCGGGCASTAPPPSTAPPSTAPGSVAPSEDPSEVGSDGYLSDPGCDADLSSICASDWDGDEEAETWGIRIPARPGPTWRRPAARRPKGMALEVMSGASAGNAPQDLALRSLCGRIASVFGDAAANPDEW